MLWFYDRLVVIDHGHAFAGLSRPGATGAGLAERTVIHSPRAFERHILRQPLKRMGGAIPRLAEIADVLREVPTADIERLLSMWPEELDMSRLSPRRGIREQLVQFLKHRRAKVSEISKNLARFIEEPEET
jgi:hypothetical protein